MSIAAIDHVTSGMRKLSDAFKDDPLGSAILRALLSRIQVLDDSARAVFDSLKLDTSTGKSLDNLGRIVGERRFGRSDAVYRLAIKLKILVNKSQGLAEDILAIASAVSGSVEYEEIFPASFVLRVLDTPWVIEQIRNFLPRIKPAGVGAWLDYVDSTSEPIRYGSSVDEDGEGLPSLVSGEPDLVASSRYYL